MKSENPYLIEFPRRGSSDLGYISIAQNQEEVPFEIKRAYWTYYTPQDVLRGGHANIGKEMVLVAVAGKIVVTTEMQGTHPETFILENPHFGLYMPMLCWHTMKYSHNAVQLVLASTIYDQSDYIRDYNQFLNYGK